jgi:aminoglycoside 6-adenylyltransferase
VDIIGGTEAQVLGRAARWASTEDKVRAVILESSRASPNPPLDALSDFDLLFVVSDIEAFKDWSWWLPWYDKPLVQWGEEVESRGLTQLARLVLYEDGTKVDHTIWPVERLKLEVESERLSDLLDVGYRVIVDKDGQASKLEAPTYTAHIPSRPTEGEYRALVEEFWWESTYVVKNLWRDELFNRKYSFECVMQLDLLRRMLEWRVELDHDWSVAPGVLGRYLKRRLPAELWAEVEATFSGPATEDNWTALYQSGDVFSRVAREVGAALGYSYPEGMEQRMRDYWRKVRQLPLDSP